MERAVCRWPDARRRAGFGSNGTKNFQNREKGRLSKVGIQVLRAVGAPLVRRAPPQADWSHLKMAETAAGQNTHRKASPHSPFSCGIPRGKAGDVPGAPPGQRRRVSGPGAEQGAGGKVPPTVPVPGGLVGAFCPRFPGGPRPCTQTAAPAGPACQLLCREGRWKDGVFHPAGPH